MEDFGNHVSICWLLICHLEVRSDLHKELQGVGELLCVGCGCLNIFTWTKLVSTSDSAARILATLLDENLALPHPPYCMARNDLEAMIRLETTHMVSKEKNSNL